MTLRLYLLAYVKLTAPNVHPVGEVQISPQRITYGKHEKASPSGAKVAASWLKSTVMLTQVFIGYTLCVHLPVASGPWQMRIYIAVSPTARIKLGDERPTPPSSRRSTAFDSTCSPAKREILRIPVGFILTTKACMRQWVA
jgi:hypothetical protein